MVRKTYIMLRCTTLKYAKSFLESGNLRFGKPNEWIKAASTNGIGRGDYLEGTFASCDKTNTEFINVIRSQNNNLICHTISNRCYFKREQALDLRTFCVFGINDDMFTTYGWSPQHEKRPCGTISLDYFSDFFGDVSEDEYDELSEDKKPVVIMIKKPEILVKRIITYFTNLGLDPKELIVSPVNYIDMNSDFIIKYNYPTELFFKSDRFRNQSEIRFVLNTQNNSILEHIEESNGIINIGNMSDISDIYDYYFHDMQMMLLDTELVFALPKAINTPIDNVEQYISYIVYALADEVPQCKNFEETQKFIKDICNLLEEKYGYKCDSEKCIFRDPSTGNTITPNWNRVSEALSSHGYNRYVNNDYLKAIDLYSRAILYSPDNAKYWFNRACCYIKLQNYKAALVDMEKAAELSPDDEEIQMHLKRFIEEYGA